MKLVINLALVLAIITCLVGAFKTSNASAQAPQNIAPYQFAEFDIPMQITKGKIFKAVHEGCEIFIATTGGYDVKDPSVSIATGRGCK